MKPLLQWSQEPGRSWSIRVSSFRPFQVLRLHVTDGARQIYRELPVIAGDLAGLDSVVNEAIQSCGA